MKIHYHSFESDRGASWAITRFTVGAANNKTALSCSWLVIDYRGERFRVSKWHEVDL
jgi:hypothetical protein